MHIRRAAIALVTVLAWAATALPALGASGVQPSEAHRTWSGIYLGISAGYATADLDWGLEYPFGAPPAYTAFAIDDILTGGHIGAQQQFGRWVVGTEVALARSIGRDRVTGVHLFSAGLTPSFTGEMTARIGWMVTATGKVGYSFGDWLAYAKGGFAWAAVGLETDDGYPPNCVTSSRGYHSGWTVGFGVERRLTDSISLGLDYSYLQLSGAVTSQIIEVGSGPLVEMSTSRIDTELHAIVGRLTFRLNWDEGR